MGNKNLKELFTDFMRECKYSGGRRSATLRGYEASFKLLTELIPNLDLAMLVPDTLTLFFERLQERERIVGRGEIRKGVKQSTVLTYRTKLNTFFIWLKGRGHLKTNPFDDMPYPKVEYSDRKYLPRQDLERILTAVSFNIPWRDNFIRKRNMAIFGILLNCGLRRGEMINLKLLDIDLQNSELTVRAETSKSKRDRVVPLNSAVTNLLQDYLNERQKLRSPNPDLFISEEGGKLTFDGLKHLQKKVIDYSGVRFHPHQFRHTFAVNLFTHNTDSIMVKELLGHKDIRMTNTYLRCLPTSAKRADVEKIARLDNLI